MQSYVSVLTILGVIILLAAWLPMVLRRLPLSLPIFCIFIGLSLSVTPLAPFAVNPLENRELTMRFCEFVVIIALMGRGSNWTEGSVGARGTSPGGCLASPCR